MGRKFFSFLIIGLFLYVAFPLLMPVILGGIFAVLFFPLLEKLEAKKFPTAVASGLLTFLVTLGVLLPAVVLIFLAAKTALQQISIWKATPTAVADAASGTTIFERVLEIPGVRSIVDRITTIFPVDVDSLALTLQDLAATIGLKVADGLSTFFTQLPGLTMGLVIMVMSLYFFLVDGRGVVHFIRRNSMMGSEQTERLIQSFGGMCRSVVLASVISGLAQSIIFLIACISVGKSNAALIAFLVFLSSFIPLVGSAPLTFGVAIHQILIGRTTEGVVLIITAVTVAIVDNIIRPMILKGGGNLHPLIAFIAAFGGLQMLGFPGIFLGPIIAGLCVVTVQNYTAENGRA